MNKWNKEEFENMLENVMNELDLSFDMIEKHDLLSTLLAELVKLVLERKNQEIQKLKKKDIVARNSYIYQHFIDSQ